MTDHDTLERLARQLCTDAGRDYDRKGCKRAHWRKRAQKAIEAGRWGGIADALAAVFGLRRVTR